MPLVVTSVMTKGILYYFNNKALKHSFRRALIVTLPSNLVF